MKYEQIAQSLHFYDFIFYETKKRTMYIYCPNCGRDYEIPITKEHNVNWIKQNQKPCSCFEYRGKQPKYKQTQYEHTDLDHQLTLAEFENRDGEAVLVSHFHTASFAASQYDSFRPFRRHPEFDEEKTIEIHFKNDSTVTMDTSLYIPMCSRRVKTGGWRRAKGWPFSTFVFDIIDDSIQELKGTNLEQFIPQIERFQEVATSRYNTEQILNENCAAWLVQMHTSQQVKKLWKAGYERLVFERTLEKMTGNRYGWGNGYPYYQHEVTTGAINWRGQTLEKILKINPSKFDLVAQRQEASVDELRGAQTVSKLEKLGVACSEQNVSIARAHRFNELIKIFSETKLPISKMFKYIRNNANKIKERASYFSLQSVTNDYFDYLETLKKLGTPYTKDVAFPSKLKEAHDRAAKTLTDLTVEMKDKVFIKAIEKYIDLAYSSDDYKIEVVKSASQLKKEAARLHNCAAGYIDRIICGECAIFVIRQKKRPKTPFFMLELNVESLKIVQNRGQGNILAPETIKSFAEDWLTKIVKANAKKLKKAA